MYESSKTNELVVVCDADDAAFLDFDFVLVEERSSFFDVDVDVDVVVVVLAIGEKHASEFPMI